MIHHLTKLWPRIVLLKSYSETFCKLTETHLCLRLLFNKVNMAHKMAASNIFIGVASK